MKVDKTVLVLVLAASLAGCARQQPAPKPASTVVPPLPADVQQVAVAVSPVPLTPAGTSPEVGPLTITGEFVSPMRSEVTARFPGRVGKMMVDEGARVRRGQPLLSLQTEYLVIDVQRAEADAARTAAVLDESQRDLDRKQDLLAKGSVSQALFDRSRGAFEQATAARAGAEANLSLARQRVQDAVLRSPLDGVVLEKRTDVGQGLGDGTVAFVLVQTAPLKLRFRLPERYMARVRQGQTVRASVDPFPGEDFRGRISTVVQAVDPATRSFSAEALFPNRDGRLRPGLFARVLLDLTEGEGGARAEAR